MLHYKFNTAAVCCLTGRPGVLAALQRYVQQLELWESVKDDEDTMLLRPTGLHCTFWHRTRSCPNEIGFRFQQTSLDRLFWKPMATTHPWEVFAFVDTTGHCKKPR